ncbi:discoidin domain-containing protein [Curtobacterium flaccumfaciens]|nr:discoidin domain-containing protein [Curtobacterium flaccumfaciens]
MPEPGSRLSWGSPVTLDEVDLADRPNADDRVTGGTLSFSDGTSVTVPALDNGGSVQRVTFPARPVGWVRFTVGSVSSTTRNVGLAEIRAYSPTDTTTPTPPPTTFTDVTGSSTPTAAWDDPSTGQTVAKAVDGVASGYPDDPTAEWVAPWGTTGVWLQLDWATPARLGRVVLHDRPNTDDQVTSGTLTFSDGSQVAVGELPNGGDPLTVDFTPRTVTWVRFTVTGVSDSTVNVGLSEVRAWSVG